MKNTVGLIVIAAILATSILAVVSNFKFAFAKNNDIRFEISDCPVQRTSTTEKSGPCPDLGAESNAGNVPDNKIVESESKVDKSSETSPVHSASPTGFETIDPFGPTTK
ncbi:MAG: hypothetical protein WBP84_00670 [Nitrososphaeraceae archaeon]